MAKNPPREMRTQRWSRRSPEDDREARRIERLLEKVEEMLEDPERDAEAVKTLEQLPAGPFPSATFHVRAGDCWIALDRLESAEAEFRAGLGVDAECADALHGLGLVHQMRDEHLEMIEAWVHVRALDLRDPKLPWAISIDEFTQAAEAAFAELPDEVHKHLVNLPIVVCDYPSEDLVRDGVDPRSLGIISGVPFSHQRMLGDSAPDLDCVQLYQLNIERIATSKEEVLEEVRITVLHETGHYFGLSDDDLDDIGLG
jgi:predicted Zn-dependent protease with MMP-like domain